MFSDCSFYTHWSHSKQRRPHELNVQSGTAQTIQQYFKPTNKKHALQNTSYTRLANAWSGYWVWVLGFFCSLASQKYGLRSRWRTGKTWVMIQQLFLLMRTEYICPWKAFVRELSLCFMKTKHLKYRSSLHICLTSVYTHKYSKCGVIHFWNTRNVY